MIGLCCQWTRQSAEAVAHLLKLEGAHAVESMHHYYSWGHGHSIHGLIALALLWPRKENWIHQAGCSPLVNGLVVDRLLAVGVLWWTLTWDMKKWTNTYSQKSIIIKICSLFLTSILVLTRLCTHQTNHSLLVKS